MKTSIIDFSHIYYMDVLYFLYTITTEIKFKIQTGTENRKQKTENRKQKTENRKQTIMINLKGFVLNHYKYLIIKYIIIC
ncbi:hypothetical protein BGI10_00915 [Snodgrassella alvi]|nr:hypothetical protein BGI07_08395 [Snodgrassella alvi]ORF33933.1 hypothetical protein BGI10_00915 [Snodgrassella alvi]